MTSTVAKRMLVCALRRRRTARAITVILEHARRMLALIALVLVLILLELTKCEEVPRNQVGQISTIGSKPFPFKPIYSTSPHHAGTNNCRHRLAVGWVPKNINGMNHVSTALFPHQRLGRDYAAQETSIFAIPSIVAVDKDPRPFPRSPDKLGKWGLPSRTWTVPDIGKNLVRQPGKKDSPSR